MQGLKQFIHDHPQVLVVVAAAGVVLAAHQYAEAVMTWKNIEDLKASEFYGG